MRDARFVLRCVTANLGCGGPHGARRVAATDAWFDTARDSSLDLLFLQEIPSYEWLARFGPAFATYPSDQIAPVFRCRSAVVVRREACRSTQASIPTAAYHGSYLAAARLELDGGVTVTGVSVHASTSRLTARDLASWPHAAPLPRVGGGPDAGRLWDADHVLETLIEIAAHGPVVAAGDFNESRRWDHSHPGETWGREYFDRVTEAGFVDCCAAAWGGIERATCGDQQLDRVLASAPIAHGVTDLSVRPPPGDGDVSDHQAIWFTLAPGRPPG